MNSSEIVATIILPVVIGPIFIFFKNLWDRYNSKKDNIKKIEYNDRIEKIREQLNKFYWPVIIKLKCLNHLNYTEVKAENIDIQEIFLNDSLSESMENKYVKKKKKNRKKGKICGNRTICEGEFVICQNILQKPDLYRLCQKCLKKSSNKIISEFSDSDLDNNIQRKKTVLSENNNDISNNDISNNDISNNDISNNDIKIKIVDDTSGTSSSSKNSIDDEDKLNKKTIKIEKILKNEIDKKIITLCVDIKNIIENNISIIKPNRKMGKELVKFIRFSETICIIDNYNSLKEKNKNSLNYNYRDLGVSNNTKKLIKIVGNNLNLLLLEEDEVKMDFLY
jgi:hypothetical protein